jgi:hypothetical protein
MIQDNKNKAVKKLSLIQKVQLGFIGLAAGIAATFTSVKAPETNLASSINLSQQPQQSIVEEKEVIEKETTTKTPEVKNGFDKVQQTQPLKISSNNNGNIKVEIDKKLISKSNTIKPIQEIKKFKSILPSIGVGEPAQAFFHPAQNYFAPSILNYGSPTKVLRTYYPWQDQQWAAWHCYNQVGLQGANFKSYKDNMCIGYYM